MMPDSTAAPDISNIIEQLRFLTRRWHELGEPAQIEIRTVGERVTPLSGRFWPDDQGIADAAKFASDMSKLPGRNAYVVVNPVRPGAGAADDADVIASFFHWADADSEAAVANLRQWAGPPWRGLTRTGTIPHARVHVFWELDRPTRDLTAWTATQKAIAAVLASDRQVVNPSRIMRIGATHTWPGEAKKAKGYVSEVGRWKAYPDRPLVDGDAMARAFRAEPQTHQAAPSGGLWAPAQAQPLDRTEAAQKAMSGEEWHNHVIRLVASYVAKGLEDHEIHALTDPLTLPGYTVEQTRREVQIAIDGARRKGWHERAQEAPQPETSANDIETGPDLFMTGADFEGHIVPPREWHVTEWIPANTVTLFYGDGGTGKSLLALQLAVATCIGSAWLGQETRSGGVFYLSAEDDRDELHRRLADVTEAEGVPLAALRNMTIMPRAGMDALLAMLDRRGNAMVKTPLMAAVEARIAQDRPALVIMDTLADLHSGEENSRAHARQFIGMMRGIAIRQRCAVVVLAHPSLTGLNTGSGSSGSTAWSNSVRSRLYLSRIVEEGEEVDPDLRTLRAMKANYSRTGAEIALRWVDGCFVPENAPSGLDRMSAGMKAERVFLRLMREFEAQGRRVSPHPSATWAPKVFAAHPDNERVTQRKFAEALDKLLGRGAVRIHHVGPPSKQRAILSLTGKEN